MNVEELEYQRSMVYDRLCDLFQNVSESNKRLDTKAQILATSAIAIVALVGAAKSLPAAQEPISTMTGLFVVFMIVFALLVLRLAAKVWVPYDKKLPGPIDVSELYKDYISKDVDDAYNNALMDLSESARSAISMNNARANSVTWMVRFLQLEIVFLAAAIFWPLAFSWFHK